MSTSKTRSGFTGLSFRVDSDFMLQLKIYRAQVHQRREDEEDKRLGQRSTTSEGGRGQKGYLDFVNDKLTGKDNDGHGTHCAHLLLKTAPRTQLYIAKVFEKDVADASENGYIQKLVDNTEEDIAKTDTEINPSAQIHHSSPLSSK
ncbi:hypothetical protein V8E54_013254 [Elaphomyces granulatus]